ncbi:hypothetical protein [Thermoactinomyces sp. CICC 10522]|uniref:hypothetical protein n=1 Tax=Thermoactinomyces sp. CICC 10522 TaxID=2767427 RepID=UPI0018DD5052|nr:hypothetical protein [Thermoactinomyces sp. CICC 10522]MBH8605604.1 hypothetical protein [Thermoactinomyces sp. CICC 10522]
MNHLPHERGNVFCVNTRFGFYYVRIEYNRQNMSYTAKLYNEYPEVEIKLPSWLPFIGDETLELKKDPLFQKTYYLSEEPDVKKAVMKTIYRFEWPKYFEEKILEMNKNVPMDYEQLTQEMRKRKKRSVLPAPQRKTIDLSQIEIHDWEDDLHDDETGT